MLQVKEFFDIDDLNGWLMVHHGYKIIDIKYAGSSNEDMASSMLVIYEE